VIDCDHDNVESEWSDADQNGLRLMQGTCLDCGAPMVPSNDEDDEGRPGWEAAWTPEEILQVAHQSGLI